MMTCSGILFWYMDSAYVPEFEVLQKLVKISLVIRITNCATLHGNRDEGIVINIWMKRDYKVLMTLSFCLDSPGFTAYFP